MVIIEAPTVELLSPQASERGRPAASAGRAAVEHPRPSTGVRRNPGGFWTSAGRKHRPR